MADHAAPGPCGERSRRGEDGGGSRGGAGPHRYPVNAAGTTIIKILVNAAGTTIIKILVNAAGTTIIKILVNAAGTTIIKPTVETTLGEWRQVVDTNLSAVDLSLAIADGGLTGSRRTDRPAAF